MEHHWGEVHLLRLATEARVAQSSVSRLKTQESSPTADMLQKLARVFRLQAWQLLDPLLDPKTAAMRSLGIEEDGAPIAWPFLTLTLAEYALLSDDEKTMVEGFARGLLAKRKPGTPD